MTPFAVRRLEYIAARELAVSSTSSSIASKAAHSVNFMRPDDRVPRRRASGAAVAQRLARGERALIVAEDDRRRRHRAGRVGAAENQPHRADISKMLVHSARAQRGRRSGGPRRRGSTPRSTPAARCWCSTPRVPRRSDCTSAAAGNASARSRSTRCCPTDRSATPWSSTRTSPSVDARLDLATARAVFPRGANDTSRLPATPRARPPRSPFCPRDARDAFAANAESSRSA